MSGRCVVCHGEKHLRACECCGEMCCGGCSSVLETERFRFLPDPPALWRDKNFFCHPCFEREVAPGLAEYDELLARSEEVQLVSKAFRGPVPCRKKKQEVNEVSDHLDQKLAVAHLKFLAAREGFDTIVALETKATKVRRHGYQHMEWSARGQFALLDHRRFRPD